MTAAKVQGVTEGVDAPREGARFTDADGRVLIVSTVQPGDPLGREVLGRIFRGDEGRDYSCSLALWQVVWRDKAP